MQGEMTVKEWLQKTMGAEVERLKARIAELEAENARLRLVVNTSPPMVSPAIPPVVITEPKGPTP